MACKTIEQLMDEVPAERLTSEIGKSFAKAWQKIHGNGEYTRYKNIMVAISGGSDSDIMIDLIERVGYPNSCVNYVFYNTGLEFAATHAHLSFLEEKYGVTIQKIRAKVPVPIGVKKYGFPFLSKRISDYIHRLQSHGFRFEDRPFEELYAEYPKCKVALKWWCNMWGESSRMNIANNKWLKEFMVANPPTIPISDGCCGGAKKQTAHMVEKMLSPDLNLQGVRRSEGGVRSVAYSSCFTEVTGGCDLYRPLYWYNKADKQAYEEAFDVIHSECYRTYGLRRTGCACCPFGDFEKELAVAEKYEPKLYKAAIGVFGPAYDYARAYRAFCAECEAHQQKGN